MKEIFFEYLCTVHILIWLFIIFAFLNINCAKLNLFYIIPIIYVLHILPFHILVETKKKIYKTNYKEKEDEFIDNTIMAPIIKIQKKLDKCFCNPLSPQGMLILGALTSSYSILHHYNVQLFKL